MVSVIVGNGKSLTGKGLGRLIDKHSVIVRCNAYKTLGHEVDVGVRVTHWIVGMNYGVNKLIERDGLPAGAERTEAIWAFCAKQSGQQRRDRRGFSRLVKGLAPVEDIVWSDLGDVPERLRGRWPTTGIVAVWTAMQKWAQPGVALDIAGFGPRDKCDEGHYDDPDSGISPVHDLEAERCLINSWENAGMVRRMDC